jgi:hypothetical protein
VEHGLLTIEVHEFLVSCPGAIGGDQAQVRVPLEEISGGRHGDDDTGASLLATSDPEQLLDGLEIEALNGRPSPISMPTRG